MFTGRGNNTTLVVEVVAGENYQESESSVEYPLPMTRTRKFYF